MSTIEHSHNASLAAISLQEAAEFVWREAEMLDRHEYNGWLALWTEAGVYAIPIDREGDDLSASLNVVLDDAEMRKARTKRLKSGFSMSSAPPARTVRTISRFVKTADEEGGIAFRCAQHIVEYKFERTRILAADVSFRLRRIDGELRLDSKIVRLVNSDDYLWGIGYLL